MKVFGSSPGTPKVFVFVELETRCAPSTLKSSCATSLLVGWVAGSESVWYNYMPSCQVGGAYFDFFFVFLVYITWYVKLRRRFWLEPQCARGCCSLTDGKERARRSVFRST